MAHDLVVLLSRRGHRYLKGCVSFAFVTFSNGLQEFAVDGDFDSILMSLFGILFPAAGCSTIANGALMAVFNERASRMQKRHEENFMLFGRIQLSAALENWTVSALEK